MAEPIYFANADEFRRWLATNADSAAELAVGFAKKGSGIPSLTWPQAVDEALCFGWIDGVRRRVDDERYQIRFSPRKAGSVWSAVNIARFLALQVEGRAAPAGVAAFAKRTEAKSRIYSYEQAEPAEFRPEETAAFRRQEAAWAYYQSLPAGYRQKVTWWVASAKQEVTRARRFATLVEACAEGRRL